MDKVPILTVMTFLPLLGGVFILFFKEKDEFMIKATAVVSTLLSFFLCLVVYFGFSKETSAIQFGEKATWIKSFGVSYQMGVDGINILMILLTTFLLLLSSIYSCTVIKEKLKEYMFSLLVIETTVLGVFLATDLFLFFIFWEAMLIPVYFMIIMWGHKDKIYAGFKFFIFTFLGSLPMLVAILALYFIHGDQTGEYTFDLFKLYQTDIPYNLQFWLFLGFFISFAVKVPFILLHTWLPDAHTEAPTVGSVVLAGLLLKTGAYGFIRYSLPLFPQVTAEATTLMLFMGVVGIVYTPVVALAQFDMKRLIAYSSIGHMGFVIIGIFSLTSLSFKGAILQMFNHGITTAALFFMAGIIYERGRTREMADFGGLWKEVPVLSAFLLIFTLSSMGLPGLNNFIGEFLVLIGLFQVNKIVVVIAVIGILSTAVYFLNMLQKVIFGPKTRDYGWNDLTRVEIGVLLALLFFVIFIGVYPQPFLEMIDSSVLDVLERVKR
jgi:NADH-quinone oxidoreductase subunit M